MATYNMIAFECNHVYALAMSASQPEHIIFIPGFMCDARLFDPQTRTLTQLGCSYSVAVMDAESTMREMACRILKETEGKFALVGLSMGGIIAQEIMKIAPERVTHLALLNTTPYEDRSLAQRKAHIKRARNGELEQILKDDLKPKYLSPASSKNEIMPIVLAMGESLGLDVFVRQSIALMIRKSNEVLLPKISCPTLILTGSDDALCPPDIHWKMAKSIPNSHLKIIESCGHLSTLEAPNHVTEALFTHWGLNKSNLIYFPTGRVGLKANA